MTKDDSKFKSKRWNEDPLKGATIQYKKKTKSELKEDNSFLEIVKKELSKKHSAK